MSQTKFRLVALLPIDAVGETVSFLLHGGAEILSLIEDEASRASSTSVVRRIPNSEMKGTGADVAFAAVSAVRATPYTSVEKAMIQSGHAAKSTGPALSQLVKQGKIERVGHAKYKRVPLCRLEQQNDCSLEQQNGNSAQA